MLLVGSDPIDRKQIRGVEGSLSVHVSRRLSTTPSAYIAPRVSSMYFRACDNVRSGDQHLEKIYELSEKDQEIRGL